MKKYKKKKKIENIEKKEIMHSLSDNIYFDQKKPEIVFLKLKIKPNSRSNNCYLNDDNICLDISSKPIKGKANIAIIKLLSKLLQISKSDIKLIKGITSKTKTFKILNLKCSIESIIEKLTKN